MSENFFEYPPFLGEFEHLEDTPNNRNGKLAHGSRGFRFGYNQAKCSERECFQCNMLDKNGRNHELTCQGPHFNRGWKGGYSSTDALKVYQPYDGPSIRKC